MAIARVCKICNNEFIGKRNQRVYCSKECAKQGLIAYDHAYYEAHKNIKKTRAKQWHKTQPQINTNFKLARNIRARLRQALKDNFKVGSAVQELGCSIEELRLYLEHQFEPWMTWANYGCFNEKLSNLANRPH
jgi:hypothetical protein